MRCHPGGEYNYQLQDRIKTLLGTNARLYYVQTKYCSAALRIHLHHYPYLHRYRSLLLQRPLWGQGRYRDLPQCRNRK